MDDIKLICCDIDGTLVRQDKSLSDENIKWIQRVVREKDVKFTIVSGRMYSSIVHFYNTIGIKCLASCLNGALLYDEDGNIIKDHRIEENVANHIYHISKDFSVAMLVIIGNEWYTECHEGFLYSEKLPIYRKPSIIENLENLLEREKVNKILFMSQEKIQIDNLREKIMKEISKDASFYYGNNFLEIMPRGINKGTAIDDLSSYYDIDKSEIMALGDDLNDLEMLSKAGYSVAMANATEEAKKVAKYLTQTNENDGVARAIARFFYHKEEI